MNSHLAIVTYCPDPAMEGTNRLMICLKSLKEVNFDLDKVVIIDDGSPTDVHLIYAMGLGVEIIRRPHNGGVCRAKNTAILALLERGTEFGFIAEDDTLFKDSFWHIQYEVAYQNTLIPHFTWAWDDDPGGMRKETVYRNNYYVTKTSRLNGVLLTFTPEMIEQVGGFKILPAKWGHTHTNWTNRILKAGIIPCYSDILDSNKYIGMNKGSRHSAITGMEKRCMKVQNQAYAKADEIYCPLLD